MNEAWEADSRIRQPGISKMNRKTTPIAMSAWQVEANLASKRRPDPMSHSVWYARPRSYLPHGFLLLNLNGHAQEGRGNGSGVLARAFVLAVEQNFQLLLQIAGLAVLFCSFECVHGWPVVFSEFIDEFGWPAGKIEDVGIPEK